MLMYFLFHSFFRQYKMLLLYIYCVSSVFLAIMAFIIVFGNLILAIYTDRNAALQTQIIHNLPFIVKFFLIHSWWIGVVFLILAILSNIFTPPFARTKKHNVGKILMETKSTRWKRLGFIVFEFAFVFFAFLLFGAIFKLYGFGLYLVLLVVYVSVDILFYKSLALTENGVWVKRTFFDVFIPYNELMVLSEKDMQTLNGTAIPIRYNNDFGIYKGVMIFCKSKNETLESFMYLYNQKVKEFRQNNTKDTQCK